MQNFSVFPRESSGKKYFYVSYRNADTGRQLSAKSIDSLAKLMGNEKHISKKTEAGEIAQKALEAGLIIEQKNEDRLFIEYLTDFWDWDKSFYVKRENKKKAKLDLFIPKVVVWA